MRNIALLAALLLAAAATAEAGYDSLDLVTEFLRFESSDPGVSNFDFLAEKMKKSVRNRMHETTEGKTALIRMIQELRPTSKDIEEEIEEIPKKVTQKKALGRALLRLLKSETQRFNNLVERTSEVVVTLMDFTPTERARSKVLRSFLYDNLTQGLGKNKWISSEDEFKKAAVKWWSAILSRKPTNSQTDMLVGGSMERVGQFVIRKLLTDNIAFTHAGWAPNGRDITHAKWKRVIGIMALVLNKRSKVLGTHCNAKTIRLAGSGLNFPLPDDYDLTCVLSAKQFGAVLKDLQDKDKGGTWNSDDRSSDFYTSNLFLADKTMVVLERTFQRMGIRPDVHFSVVKEGSKYDRSPMLIGASSIFDGGETYKKLYPMNEYLFAERPLEVVLRFGLPDKFSEIVDKMTKKSYDERGISCRLDAALAYPVARGGMMPQCERCDEKFKSASGEWLRGYSCDKQGSACNGKPDVLCYTYRRATCVCSSFSDEFVDRARWGGDIEVM